MNGNLTPIRIGILGLGRGFMLALPTLAQDPRLSLVAAFDRDARASAAFARDFNAIVHNSVEDLCADPAVELVYVATPHEMHAAHAAAAAHAGRHLLVEKPMALRLADCSRMVDAARQAGVKLLVGPSHAWDAPVLHARRLIAQGAIGRVRFITSLQYTDFLHRPRRAAELDTAQGGGVVMSQAAHQMDVARLLAGGRVRSVQAVTHRWPTHANGRAGTCEGAYQALVQFAGEGNEPGPSATLVYSGHAGFDTDAWMDGIGEMAQTKAPGAHARARQTLAAMVDEPGREAAFKASRGYGGVATGAATPAPAPQAHPHFGPVIVSGEAGDLRLTPRGLWIADGQGERFEPTPLPEVPRESIADELWRVLRRGEVPLFSGEWERATTAATLAILESAAQGGQPVAPAYQCAPS
ncbi:MAG TPA: Gfo/Idh/MocA family oxidoreductase [Burkholderiaceae bacterium]|nr:Gfo/Idh/MocA family oxidoreductase [Burkholderiaceae bacterium]